MLVENFLEDGEEAPPRAEGEEGGKDKKGKDKKGGKGGEGDGDACKVLLELCVDDGAMYVPEAWRSRTPYEHKTHTAPLKLPGAPDAEPIAAVEVPEDGVGGVLHSVPLPPVSV